MIPKVIPNSDSLRYRGEAIYLPAAGRIWIPIRKNAHTSIFEAIITSRHPWMPCADLHSLPPAPRVALWRNPHGRMEAAYYTLQPKEYFNPWVQRICAQPDAERDPHVMSQYLSVTLLYPDLPQFIFHWDFPALASALGLGPIPHLNNSLGSTHTWTGVSLLAFAKAYADDLRIWSQP